MNCVNIAAQLGNFGLNQVIAVVTLQAATREVIAVLSALFTLDTGEILTTTTLARVVALQRIQLGAELVAFTLSTSLV